MFVVKSKNFNIRSICLLLKSWYGALTVLTQLPLARFFDPQAPLPAARGVGITVNCTYNDYIIYWIKTRL